MNGPVFVHHGMMGMCGSAYTPPPDSTRRRPIFVWVYARDGRAGFDLNRRGEAGAREVATVYVRSCIMIITGLGSGRFMVSFISTVPYCTRVICGGDVLFC